MKRILALDVRPVLLIAALTIAVFAPAAGQVATSVASPTEDSAPCTTLFGIALGNACVLVMHVAPDAGPLDVYVDGALAVPGTTLGTLGEFIPIASGERLFQFVPSGATVEDAVAELTIALEAGIAYEVAALGPIDDLRTAVLAVDTAPLPDLTSRLRLAHASSDAPAVDLVDAAGAALIEHLAFARVSDYVEIPAGTYELAANVSGSTELALPLPGTVLIPNTVYTVYVTGLVEDGSLGAVLVPVLVSPDLVGATPVA